MLGQGISTVASILTAIVGLAIVAVLVGQNSKTSDVLKAGGTAIQGLIQVAVSPVTGGTGGSAGFSTVSDPGLSNLAGLFNGTFA